MLFNTRNVDWAALTLRFFVPQTEQVAAEPAAPGEIEGLEQSESPQFWREAVLGLKKWQQMAP